MIAVLSGGGRAGGRRTLLVGVAPLGQDCPRPYPPLGPGPIRPRRDTLRVMPASGRAIGVAWRVALWLVALVAVLLIAQLNGVLWAALQLALGLLVFCGGLGFVLAPLIRRSRGAEQAPHPYVRPSFVLGLLTTMVGLGLTIVALVRLVRGQIARSCRGPGLLVGRPDPAETIRPEPVAERAQRRCERRLADRAAEQVGNGHPAAGQRAVCGDVVAACLLEGGQGVCGGEVAGGRPTGQRLGAGPDCQPDRRGQVAIGDRSPGRQQRELRSDGVPAELVRGRLPSLRPRGRRAGPSVGPRDRADRDR